MLKPIALLLIVALTSCSQGQPSTDNMPSPAIAPEIFPVQPVTIVNAGESWGADIRLSFTKMSLTDSSVVYDVRSAYNNKNIGFTLTVPAEGFSKLTIQSIGEGSNNFLHLLQTLYNQKTDSATFTNSITADCINLASLYRAAGKGTVVAAERKVFLQGSTADDYAELYININDNEHWIELKEKDTEYRAAIVKFFSKR